MKKVIMLIVLGVIISGCATTGHLQTPSGRPEVFIEGVTNKDVTNGCVSFLTEKGWQIEQATEYIVQAVHTSDNAMADFMLGSQYDYQTWYRVTITIAKENNGVKVYGSQQLVSNKGSGFEKNMQLTSQKAYEGTQNCLNAIRNRTLQNK